MHGLSEISCHAQIPPNVSSYRGALDASLAAEKFGVAPALLAQVATVEAVWVAKKEGKLIFEEFKHVFVIIQYLYVFSGGVFMIWQFSVRQNSQRCQKDCKCHAGHTFDRIFEMKKTSDLFVFTISEILDWIDYDCIIVYGYCHIMYILRYQLQRSAKIQNPSSLCVK